MNERWVLATIQASDGKEKNRRAGPTTASAIVGKLSSPVDDVQYEVFGVLNNLDPLPINTAAKLWYGLRWFRFRESADSPDFYMRSDVVTISNIRDIKTPLEERMDAVESDVAALNERMNTIESQHP